MHRRVVRPAAPATAVGRATGVLTRLRQLVVVVGVFLFAFAMAALAVSDGPPHRTVNLQFQHSDAVSH